MQGLDEFINADGFQTKEELKLQRNNEHNKNLLAVSKKTLNAYLFISIVTLIISIVSIILNYSSCKSDKKTSIVGDSLKNDTSKDIIIYKDTINKDSLIKLK